MAVNTNEQLNIANARKAKEDFDKAKAKAEEAKAKLIAAKKKADQVRKTLDELNRAYKAGGLSAGLSSIVASQAGMLKGKVVAQIQSRLIQTLQKFANQCPNQKELERIIRLRNNLLQQLSSIESRISGFRSVASSLNATTQGLKIGIELIKSIPTPTAIIPPQTGGLGVPMSVLNRYSDRLSKLNTLLDKFTNEAKAVTSVVDTALPTIQMVKSKLQLLDVAIQACAESQGMLDSTTGGVQGMVGILDVAQPQGNTGSEGIPSSDYLYKGYTLAIIQDPNSPKIAPRRFAIAKNSRGTVILQGPSSFSSSTQVLLDEVKFRIDNQLP